MYPSGITEGRGGSMGGGGVWKALRNSGKFCDLSADVYTATTILDYSRYGTRG